MAITTIAGLSEITSPVAADQVSAWDAGAGVHGWMTVANLIGVVVTGGGVVATGGFTLTVPETGTAALRDVANTFTVAQTIAPAGVAVRPLTVNSPTGATAPATTLQYNGDSIFALYPSADRIIQGIQFFALANEGILTIGNVVGTVEIIQSSTAQYGKYFVRGGINSVQEISNPGSYFTTTKGTANKINVYYESSNYYIQNKSGVSLNLSITIRQSESIT